MKKIIQFSAFLAFLTLFSVNVFAVDYDLWIAGVRVTDANKDTITAAIVAAGKTASGVITYDLTTNTLTLDNAYINTSTVCISQDIDNLTINLVGDNILISNTNAIRLYDNTTITGSGSVSVTAHRTASAIGQLENYNTTLTINNTTVLFSGGSGYNGGNKGNIVINNSTVRATGEANYGSIWRCNSLTLNGCAIVQPANAIFDTEQKAVCLNGAPVAGQEVIIVPTYDLYVAGMQVHELNKNYIIPVLATAGRTASGVITYDPESKTLTLDNASISSSTIGIKNSINNLTINLVGESTLTSTADDVLRLYANTTIKGSGSLTALINNTILKSGIWFNSDTLTIENSIVTSNGGSFGIGDNNQGTLIINNSTVKATGINSGSISNMRNMVLTGCAIAQPAGAAFDASQKAVCLDGERVKTEVVIAPFPTISVADATACDSYTLPTSDTSDTWVWTNENDEIITEATESGVYTVVATSEYDLTATETINVTINPLPTVEIVQEGNILTATAGMATYIWNTNETTESIAISATGNYSVTVTNAAGCESTANIEVTEIPTTGINEMAVPKMAVYPNPNNGNFTINLGDIDNAISYQIVDIKGAIVKEGKINNNKELISIQAKAGNYVVRVITDKNVFVEQIIVQ